MARPKEKIDEDTLRKLGLVVLEDDESKMWLLIYDLGLKFLFDRACKKNNISYAKFKDWVYLEDKKVNRIRSRIKNQVCDHIRQNFDVMNMLPFSIHDLIDHLSKQGADWSDMKSWHIDHIKQKNQLKFKTFKDENFIKCWSLSNLRVLPAEENLKRPKNV